MVWSAPSGCWYSRAVRWADTPPVSSHARRTTLAGARVWASWSSWWGVGGWDMVVLRLMLVKGNEKQQPYGDVITSP